MSHGFGYSESVFYFRLEQVFLRLFVDFLVDFHDLSINFTFQFRHDLQLRIVDDVCEACQTQVFQGEVSLLVDVSVVVLRYFWTWII